MIAGAIGAAVLLTSIAIAAWTTWYLRRDRVELPSELNQQRATIRTKLQALVGDVPTSPALLDDQFPVHPRTAAVVAKLLADSPRGALAEAERVLADCGGEARAHVLVARACLAMNELDATQQQVLRARALGDDSPMLRFLEARVMVLSHLRQVHVDNADNAEIHASPLPSLVTPIELLLLSLEKQRRTSDGGSGVWVPGRGSVSDEEIVTMVAAHFRIYYQAIELLLGAATEVKGFADALYHIGRLGLKIGMAELGRDLLKTIEPLMQSSPDRRSYERDLAQLNGDDSAQLSPLPKLTGTAKRSPSLRVLD